jgi:hypothetical protein
VDDNAGAAGRLAHARVVSEMQRVWDAAGERGRHVVLHATLADVVQFVDDPCDQ